jgi:hypothetical protein
MRMQNVLGVLGVAGATMAFTLVALGPWNVGVSKEAKSITPTIVQPKFASHGCEFALKTEKPAYKPGESPVVEVTAVNPTGKAIEATVWVGILTTDVPSPMSRVMALPRPTWSKPWSVSLKPGERTTTKLAANVKLAANQVISITISDTKRAVMVKELPVRRNGLLKKSEPLKKGVAAK